jgi:hypothetical protein
MKKRFLPFLLMAISPGAFSQATSPQTTTAASQTIIANSPATIVKYLSGTDKDHTVQWDFYCTGGRNSGKWTQIAVPSNWELQGFGNYNYGHDKVKSNEQGIYKYAFKTEPGWRNKRIYLVFEGSMTDTRVEINGKLAGPIHQGSFYRFKYDITELIKKTPPGNTDAGNADAENLMEVTVSKTSANASVNNAERGNSDFWLFGGIFRPVYLEIVPPAFIDRIAINAKADGSFQMDVYPQNVKRDYTIEAQVTKLNGENVGKPFSVKAAALAADTSKTDALVELKSQFTNPLLWSSEFPNLYQVIVSLKDRNRIIHQVRQRFGFRTVERRKGDGFYVNGVKILFKGSDRHSFWPETGRTLSHGIDLMDVGLMKEMNMNAVRMSHYPPDQDFLDVCDSLGLYVLDELTGWQAAYDTLVGHQLVKEMVVRDVNHPSVVIWDNGNEGGWNRGLDNDYGLYDPQDRIVIHPTERFNGTNTKHYPDYNYVLNSVANEKDVFFPTEFMHGLYDGGAGAALDDYWNLMLTHPRGAGGFIWAFLDEGVLRTDKNGYYDTDGNHAPDGIVGPHREKEGSFYTIKEIWSPVYVDPPIPDGGFNGQLRVENRYWFTNLDQCTFKWNLVSFPAPADSTIHPRIIATGRPSAPNVLPGKSGSLNLGLPTGWAKSDALYLTAYGPDKKELFTWSWAINGPADIRKAMRTQAVRSRKAIQPDGLLRPQTPEALDRGDTLIIRCNGLKYYFDQKTGFITQVITPEHKVSLSGGPVLAGVATTLTSFHYSTGKDQCMVTADYGGAATLHIQWTFVAGHPAKLEYTYTQSGPADFTGITFNYPEDQITGMKWLGRGPYHVWKNRLKGQQFGVWYKDYNNAVTGENWIYPEFKGYHAEVNWVVIENRESPFTIYMDNKDIYLQMLHPQRAKDSPSNNNVDPPFPEGSIGILNAISPIGDKFHAANVLGPQSQKNIADGKPVSGTIWLDFGD